MRLHIADHPLIAHKLTVLRDRDTHSATFRQLVDELVTLLAYEATRHVSTTEIAINTPVAPTVGKRISEPRPIVVPVLRAGLGMLEGMTSLLPTAEVGCLGCGATGVGRAETARVGAGGQVGDERRDVHAGDRPAVLSADGDRVRSGDDPFATVTTDVGINASFDRAQQCRFPVISAADNHSHTLRDAHAGDPATAGQVEGDPQIFWALEGNDRIACERQIGIAGGAGLGITVPAMMIQAYRRRRALDS